MGVPKFLRLGAGQAEIPSLIHAGGAWWSTPAVTVPPTHYSGRARVADRSHTGCRAGGARRGPDGAELSLSWAAALAPRGRGRLEGLVDSESRRGLRGG